MRDPVATDRCAVPRVAERAAQAAGSARTLEEPTQPPVGPCSHGEALLPLQTFGPYELDELLGRGRTGEVHRAWDTARHRTVALRILLPALTGDARFRSRFLADCARAAQVEEEHVAAVHGAGEIDGRLYVDGQLVDGRALSAVLAAEGPLPVDRALDVVGQVAAALDAAHAAGLVHGDVSPADVLLSGHSTRPDCHLTGFGLAGAGGGPRYVAPETLAGRPADHLVDVHALACLLYEVLTGRPPLRGEPPRPSAVVGSVPHPLDDVVARGTAQDPGRRYRSAGELARAARAALVPAPDTVPLRSAPPAPPSGGAGGSGAVAGAAGASDTGRHRLPATGARSGRRRRLVAALVAGGLALATAGGVAATQLTSDASDATVATPVDLEPVDAPGEDPFVPMPGQVPPEAADPAPATGGSGTGTDGTGTDGTGTDGTGTDGTGTDGTGTNGTGTDGTGTDGTGTDGTGTDGTGTEPATPDGDTAGEDTAGEDTAGEDTAGEDTAGEDTAGEDTAGEDTAGETTPAAGGPVAGDQPGLYGGSGEEVCDVAAMTAYLTGHPDRAAAWAGVQDVATDAIGDHLASLTPVVLRFDTAVTNHGFSDGRAVPFQSVLQAGTAVLVDDSGVPQVRCACGNPLAPPASRPSPDYRGDPWPGFAPATVVVVERSPAPVSALVVVDEATGAVEARPVGTSGDADRPVDPGLAERARAFGSERGTTPPGSGTPSAVPPATDPGQTGPAAPDPPPADGPAGTEEPPTDAGTAPQEAEGEPGGTSTPDPGSGTSGPPDQDPPSPDVPEPDGAPPDDGTAGEAPAEEAPAEEAPAEEAPAEEAPPQEAPPPEEPAPGAPAQEAPLPEDPAPEAPVDEQTVEEQPVEEPTEQEAPVEDAPVEDAPVDQLPPEETAIP
ncbi:serine/threonine protein kinase [Geodermatophilus normandii]|uniref:non-specific serine/threonine protein kinase n=1 Tax=Geodermatophilus normandii TaxID=1137989 RepID=A0A317QKX3_9ACTN|nr:DUF6777 domain-containing protein [Geodermatophilus normandii]PWW23391.1 serine/threonine protein kinase [Geodermatophilus normandii]